MIPQLRIVATTRCGRSCVYCRPSGEAATACAMDAFARIEDVVALAKLYKEHGGDEVKITGGDPVFWPDLVSCVDRLKREVGFERVEVITRSPAIAHVLGDLVEAGLDVLNFSLDTLEPQTYRRVVGRDDLAELTDTIREAAKLVYTKINTVVMKRINHTSVDALIEFCELNGVRQLKLLDLIVDLHDSDMPGSDRSVRAYGVPLSDLDLPLAPITDKLRKRAVASDIILQGGLGHPMSRFLLPSGLDVRIKDSRNGAWYGDMCRSCGMYPCHDALMAVRYLPEQALQLCLLNPGNNVPLNFDSHEQLSESFLRAMSQYSQATFTSNSTVTS